MGYNWKMIKIVIVGGGFGGVYTALNLCKKFSKLEVAITLISKSNFFLFTPLLHEVATGSLTQDSVIESLHEVFRGTCVNIVEDTVVEVDRINKSIKTASASYLYDYLVLSTGAETNYFGIPGADTHTFTLKHLVDAVKLRNHIIQTCENAVKTKNKDLLTIAIIGAGPTGVELAAELQEYMQHTLCTYFKNSGFKKEDIKINLITMTPDVIPQFPHKMREFALVELNKRNIQVMLNKFVMNIDPHRITFKDSSTLDAYTIIWVAGIIPSFSKIKGVDEGFIIAKNGRIAVNEFLQSTVDSSLFALGDSSGTHPMLAQVAVQQGKIVANNIFALINRTSLHPFIFRQKGLLLSIGQWYAIGNFAGLTFRGRIMWWIWRTAYLANFLSWRKKFEIAFEWTENLFSPRDISYLE
jgi:NADH dehydrogenase